MKRAADIAAPSVTRTSSSARLRSIGVPRSRRSTSEEAAMVAGSYVGGTARTSRDQALQPERGHGISGAAHALSERFGEERRVVPLVLRAHPEEAAGHGVAGAGGID